MVYDWNAGWFCAQWSAIILISWEVIFCYCLSVKKSIFYLFTFRGKLPRYYGRFLVFICLQVDSDLIWMVSPCFKYYFIIKLLVLLHVLILYKTLQELILCTCFSILFQLLIFSQPVSYSYLILSLALWLFSDWIVLRIFNERFKARENSDSVYIQFKQNTISVNKIFLAQCQWGIYFQLKPPTFFTSIQAQYTGFYFKILNISFSHVKHLSLFSKWTNLLIKIVE